MPSAKLFVWGVLTQLLTKSIAWVYTVFFLPMDRLLNASRWQTAKGFDSWPSVMHSRSQGLTDCWELVAMSCQDGKLFTQQCCRSCTDQQHMQPAWHPVPQGQGSDYQ